MFSGFSGLQGAFPGKRTLLSRCLLVWILTVKYFGTGKLLCKPDLRIWCSRTLLWFLLLDFSLGLPVSVDVFRHCCTEKGLLGCMKTGSCPGVHTKVRTSLPLTASVFPLPNILLSQFFPLCVLLWIKVLKFSPMTWISPHLWSEFRVLLPCSIIFVLMSKVVF